MEKEYMLAHLLDEPKKERAEFQSWPAHITLLPWFVCNDLVAVEDALEEVCEKTQPLLLSVGSFAMLGSRRATEVRRVERTNELLKFHLLIKGIIDDFRGINGDADFQRKVEYFGPNYNPHITKHTSYEEGQLIIIDHISLVSADITEPHGHRIKTIERNYTLGGQYEAAA